MISSPFSQAAPDYWSAGLPVIPLDPCRKSTKQTGWTKFCEEMPSPEQQAQWLSETFSYNIGLPLGPQSGLCMIDIDTEDEELTAKILAALPASPWKRVGKKGMALAYRYEGTSNFKIKAPDTSMVVEHLGKGNQLVLPPSIHPDCSTCGSEEVATPAGVCGTCGAPATVYSANADLWQVLDQVQPLPAGIKSTLQAIINAHFGAATGDQGGGETNKGGRKVRLTKAAGEWRAQGMDIPELRERLYELNREKNKPPLPDHEVEDVLKSAAKWEKGDGLDFTDLGNAERLAQRLKGRALYVAEYKDWVFWNGNIWTRQQAADCVRREAHAIVKEMARSNNPWINAKGIQFQARRSIEAMVAIFPTLQGCSVSASDFDQDPDLLNTPGGVVNLRTGELMLPDSKYLMLHCTAYAPDPQMPTPYFDKVLKDAFEGDGEKQRMFEDFIGYSVTGDMGLRKFMVGTGSGRNCKSVCTNIAADVIGSYARVLPITALMASRPSGGAQPELAVLQGARLALATEGSRGQVLDTAILKRWVGGDRISVRRVYENNFEFKPTVKILMVTNHLPSIDCEDQAIWDRAIILPFTHRIEDADVDPTMPEKLLAEGPGILARMIEWAARTYREGIHVPGSLQAVADGYRQEMDVVGSFIAECCIVSDSVETPSSLLFIKFEEFCESVGAPSMTKNRFGRVLTERGFVSRKSSLSIRTGIALRPYYDRQEAAE